MGVKIHKRKIHRKAQENPSSWAQRSKIDSKNKSSKNDANFKIGIIIEQNLKPYVISA